MSTPPHSAEGPGTIPLSVVIPAYNRAPLVGRAVASALAQRPHPPAEVIVVDDGSQDGTAEAAEAAGARVVVHDRNRGEGASRNTGIAAAQHDWIGLLDSDDEWLPELLETLWPHRAGHLLVGGASLSVGGEPPTQRYAGVLGRKPFLLEDPSSLIFPENFIAASGTIVQRRVVADVGGYLPLKQGADLDLWIRVLERGTGLVLPAPVVRYHLHDGQVTQDYEAMATAHERIALTYADRPWFTKALLERWRGAAHWDTLRRAARRRDAAGVRQELLALFTHPSRVAGATEILVRRGRLRRVTRALSSAAARHAVATVHPS